MRGVITMLRLSLAGRTPRLIPGQYLKGWSSLYRLARKIQSISNLSCLFCVSGRTSTWTTMNTTCLRPNYVIISSRCSTKRQQNSAPRICSWWNWNYRKPPLNSGWVSNDSNWGLSSDVRDDSRFVPSQWETAILCSDVSHWLGTSLESALDVMSADRSVSFKWKLCNHWLTHWG